MEMDLTTYPKHELDLETERDFKSRLRSLCGLFVSVHHGKVYFIHQTAREFLSADAIMSARLRQVERWEHSITSRYAHKVLAEQCVRYVSFFDSAAESLINNTSDYGVDSFLDYAAAWWPVHFREARLSSSEDPLATHQGLGISDPKLFCFLRWFTIYSKFQDDGLHRYDPHLIIVSLLGHDVLVQTLLDNGVDVNARGRYHGNALYAASTRGYEQVVKMLLVRGANVNAQNGHYSSALYAASYEGHEQVVEILLDDGVNLNAQGGEYGNALLAASANGRKEVVEVLLNNSANVNAQGGDFGNALLAASYKGHEQIVEILLNKGAEINPQGGYYGKALQAASFQGHKKVVEMLMDNGAITNAKDGVYNSALQAASA